MSYKFVDLELPLHVIVDQARELSAAFDAAKGTPLNETHRQKVSGQEENAVPTFQTRPVTSWNAVTVLAIELRSVTGLTYAGSRFPVQQLRRR